MVQMTTLYDSMVSQYDSLANPALPATDRPMAAGVVGFLFFTG